MEILPHEKKIYEYIKSIEHLKKQNQGGELFLSDITKLEEKLTVLKEEIYSNLTPWERVMICRHPQRPHTVDYIEHICDDFVELFGDRLHADDRSIVGGLARIDGVKCVVMGQEKGKDTESRVMRNFGMLHPEGFRKALRLMKLAEKFSLPVVSLLDTPGAYPGLEAEERGQGWAIAHNLREMARIQTAILVIVIGEGCSGGALGMGVGDVVGMLEHSYYSVISPEGCASILWKDASRNVDAASALKLNAENLLEFAIVDEVIKEPLGGAHHNPAEVYANMKRFIREHWESLRNIRMETLLEKRYQKFRCIGQYQQEQPR